MDIIKKAYDLFFDIVKYVCVAIMLIMVAIIGYCVFMRFVMNDTPRWGDEMAIFSMIWFCLLSASWAFKENRHIRIGFWSGVFPPKVLLVMEIFVHLVALVTFVFVTYYAFEMIEMAGKVKLSGSGIPIKYLYYAEPAAFVCLTIAGIGRLVEIIGGAIHGSK